MARPVTRESYLSPDIMVGIDNLFPKRTNFAALAEVHVQVLHRMLNQLPCNEEDVAAVTRTWDRYRPAAVRELINKPTAELSPRDRLRLYELVTKSYQAAYGAKVPEGPR